jgi:hypothetical protein
MRTVRAGKEGVQELTAFLTAKPVAPRRATDEAVLRRVRKALHPPLWAVLGKLTLVEAAAGLGTLALCPQFDIGFGSHNEILHSLHIWGPLLHYFACGIFFVLFGAVLAGMLLRREDRQTLGQGKYLYFLAYSLVAYAVFVSLGAEVFLVGSLLWLCGAVLGNYLGLALGAKMRTVLS